MKDNIIFKRLEKLQEIVEQNYMINSFKFSFSYEGENLKCEIFIKANIDFDNFRLVLIKVLVFSGANFIYDQCDSNNWRCEFWVKNSNTLNDIEKFANLYLIIEDILE